ncbi:MAG: tail fiber domain-containing protein [Thermoflexales bacterium]|nr:tail fiber domain-containing protein [Thermoflexales bacterium]
MSRTTRALIASALAAGLTLMLSSGQLMAQFNTFSYQGRLTNNGVPVNETCDFQFGLWDNSTLSTQIGTTQTLTVTVTGGYFTVPDLNFGAGSITGQPRWLAIAVRCPTGSGSYTPLNPRQRLTPTPHALALPGFWTRPNITSPNIIGGYTDNQVANGVVGATISGGGTNGGLNQVTDEYGTVGGGTSNRAGNASGSLSDAWYATVGGGRSNLARGSYATVGGGFYNSAGGHTAFIGGGSTNTADGDYATVPGGVENRADGDYSFAAGRRAIALAAGMFVWADSHDENFSGSAPNSFIVRASNGIFFGKCITCTGASSGKYIDTWTGAHLTNGGAWVNASDRAIKENFAIVDARRILSGVISLPIQTWNYTVESDTIRHIGPTAQDFYAAFSVGADDKHIATVDADGVALAAIQGLHQLVQEKDAQMASLQAQNAALQAKLAVLEARLAALEQHIAGGQR